VRTTTTAADAALTDAQNQTVHGSKRTVTTRPAE
jgi:hypothetical protein